MSQEASSANNVSSIPVEELLAWYQHEQGEIKRERARLEQVRETAAIEGIDIERDLEGAGFRLNGRIEELNGFAAFLMSKEIIVEIVVDEEE